MKEKLIQYQKPLLAVGLLVLLLVLYFYRHRLFKGTLLTGSKPTAVSNNTTTSNPESLLLKKGSQGEQVRQLQQLLNQEHQKHAPTFIPLLEEDGIFGDRTEQMLLRYTQQKSITLAQLQTSLAAA
ncbi:MULTISPECIES: peptidoglycan-binding protein [unclassified Aureispira]|uniref:peptidoglycan-binding domain-containing protein n=1 Tax=unclassified Aureispira TaxID=2649989 RepID=UPI0006981AD4|nr:MULTISPECIES: hypothetical protein [unclassified Aureispira]WMX16327.1 hypothetical protein QP953_08110 [Aureispira sp. CCB-E]